MEKDNPWRLTKEQLLETQKINQKTDEELKKKNSEGTEDDDGFEREREFRLKRDDDEHVR